MSIFQSFSQKNNQKFGSNLPATYLRMNLTNNAYGPSRKFFQLIQINYILTMRNISKHLMSPAIAVAVAFGFTACQDDLTDVTEETALGGGGEDMVLESVLSIDYDKDNDNYYVVGVSPSGDIDVYYGADKSWTKLQENRDIDNRYSPSQFVDFALGAEPGEAMFGVAVGNIEDYKIGFRQYAPRATSINTREFSDKPWFGDGKPEAIGNLEKAIKIEYDQTNNDYYVIGKGSGEDKALEVWYGQHDNWTELEGNPSEWLNKRFGTEGPADSKFVDFAVGDGDSDHYGVVVGIFNGEVSSTRIDNRNGKLFFTASRPRSIGSLTDVKSIDYDTENNIFVVVGEGPDGIDVYYGKHNDWTKLQENRDIDNLYSYDEFVDFAIGDGDTMYGVAIGNKIFDVDKRPGSSNKDFQQRGTSINAREFYNKPWFGDGSPEIIQ